MLAKHSLEHLFHSPLVGHAIIDSDNRIRNANPAFARFTRYSTQQLNGLPLATLLHQSSQIPPTDKTARLRFRSKDGQLLWGDTCVLPLYLEKSDKKEPVPPHGRTQSDNNGFVLQVCDCTRAHLEEQINTGRTKVLELLYSNHNLSTICETIVHCIEALDDGVRCSILLLNPERGTLHKVAAPSLPDFYNDAIEGMQIGDGIGSCGTAVFRRERVIVADILTHPYWTRAKRLIERTPMRACWSEPIIAHDGNVLGSFALYYDTPREPQPEEVSLIASAAALTSIVVGYKRGEQLLRDLDRAKDEFISTAAHELRTPLTAIMGYAELLFDGEIDPACQRAYATEIHSRGETLARLIDDLLDVSLMQIGRSLKLESKPTELLPLMNRVVQHFQRNFLQHQLELRCSADLPVLMTCDSGRIIQVLENLLSNAIKYSPQGGAVVLEITRSPTSLIFCVSDQGIGMSDSVMLHAFDKFFRADASNTAPTGLGIGLSIVRKIIEAHGGEIHLESRLQEGTRVTFTLPI